MTLGGSAALESAGTSSQNIWSSHTTRDRTLLAVGAIVCYVIFKWVCAAFGVPLHPGYAISILQQPSPLMAIVVIFATLAACTALASMIAGVVHVEAGLFCAALGMVAVSVRGGPARYVVMNASGPSVFLMLCTELVLLYAGVGIGWFVLRTLAGAGLLRREELRETHREHDHVPSQGALALATQVITMLFVMVLLSQTDRKGQVTWAVFIASLLGALTAHSLFPVRPSIWFWIGPLIVGGAGYLIAFATGGYSITGVIGGMMPSLARPLPIDYASVGPAGAILGYWASRNWQLEREKDPTEPDEVEDALERPAV